MRTLPEIIYKKLNVFRSRSSKFLIWYRDISCFFFGHRYTYLSDVFGNNKGAKVCKRCHRFMSKHGDEEFYHNWESDYGKFARCHNHNE